MILCCGEALVDMVPFAMEDAEGGEGYRPCPGGSPYNSAIAIGRLGVPVDFVGRLSHDFFGQMLIRRLAANGVGTSRIVRSRQPSTLAFVKLAHGAEPQYAFYVTDSADRSLSLADLPAELPMDVRCILFGSISMTMEPVASTVEALVMRETARRVISFDPNVRPVLVPDRGAYVRRMEGWFALSTIVKISAADLDYVYPHLDLDAAVDRVLSCGPALIAITLGSDGALAVGSRSTGGRFRATATAIKVPVVDTIGAGDTFHAALLAWLELHGRMSRSAIAELPEHELGAALLFANKAAALVCTRRGAEPPTMAELTACSGS
jgi:fructokinase